MPNITIRIDEATYRAARVQAATAGTTVSALVRDFLRSRGKAEEERDRRRIAALREIFAATAPNPRPRRRPVRPLTRDEIHAAVLR